MSLCFSDLVSSVLSLPNMYRRIWGYEEWNLLVGLCKVRFCLNEVSNLKQTVDLLLCPKNESNNQQGNDSEPSQWKDFLL